MNGALPHRRGWGWLAVAMLLTTLAVGCGTRSASGTCRDYTPLDMCPVGTRYQCETTADGCRWCSCVPTENPTVGPPPPQ